jgi:hypothetical protein
VTIDALTPLAIASAVLLAVEFSALLSGGVYGGTAALLALAIASHLFALCTSLAAALRSTAEFVREGAA